MLFLRLSFCIFLLKIAAALPAGVHIGRDGSVGASWGGYSASAGLGGLVGGGGPKGGLHAQAGTPDGHFAAAGLGGSVSERGGPQGGLYSTAGQAKPVVVAQPVPVAQPVGGVSNSQASASASSHAGGGSGGNGLVYTNRRPGSFFDDIFNIPISTLGAVNQYLNNRHRVVHTVAVPVYQPTVQTSQAGSSSKAQASSSSSSSSSASSSASAGSSANSGAGVAATPIDNTIYHGYVKNPNYNDVFNIPISVLGAVNKFLNGK